MVGRRQKAKLGELSRHIVHILTLLLHQTFLLVAHGRPQPGDERGEFPVLFVSDVERAVLRVVTPQFLEIIFPQLIGDAPNEPDLSA